MTTVADATPLIVLASAGDLELLKFLFERVIVPEGVLHEVVTQGRGRPGAEAVLAAAGHWLDVVSSHRPERVLELMEHHKLDLGESEAIALAEQAPDTRLLADDHRAVLFARSAGMTVVRTPGLYALAKDRGLIAAVKPRLDVLRRNGFWLGEAEFQRILKEVGEEA